MTCTPGVGSPGTSRVRKAARIDRLASIGCLLFALLPRAGSSEERRLITLDDPLRIHSVSDPRVSPDGAWVAYVVTTQDLKADRKQSDLWMTSWDGSTTLRLTTTAKESESSPRWSPDGRYLAFLSSRGDDNEADQLWLLPRAGGEAERVSELKSGVADYAWSPDGTRLVLAIADSDTVAQGGEGGKDKTAPPIVIDRFYFMDDVEGYLTHKRTHLYLFDLATRAAQQLTRGDQDDLDAVWSPDGKSIAFLSKHGADADRTSSWEIYVVAAQSGAEPRQLTRFEGVVNNPDADYGIAWSPDGGSIAFLQGGVPKLIYYVPLRLAVVPAAGGPVRVLTRDLDREISGIAWAPDSRSILGIVEDDRARRLVRVPAAGGRPQPLVAGKRVVSAFDVSRSGRIAVVMSTPTTVPEVFALDGAEPRPLSRQNDSLLAELRLGSMEEISFKSRDGTKINGFMLKPPDFQKGKRYPTLLRIHGGPVSQHEYELDPMWQLFAAHGYVVVAANPRGSSGRGQQFAQAIFADWGNKDTQDVVAAVDYAISIGVADPNRLGVGGWSYGAILTNFVITQDPRFKAATSGAGSSNFLAGYGTDEYVRVWEAELGTPWTATAAYVRLSSPFLHANRIVTPTLFMCGEKDLNVPLLNSEQMYQALKSLGRDTQLIIYPGQRHSLSKPSYTRDRNRRYLDWYDQHLK